MYVHSHSISTCLLELTQFNRLLITINSESSIERLGEGGLDSVEESHGVRDAVEGQNTCMMIQVHSYLGGLRTWDGGADVVMPECITVA